MYERDTRHIHRISQMTWAAGLDDPDDYLVRTTREDLENLRQENRWTKDKED